MKVLVTGAEGMVGSTLCPALRREGHQVQVTDLKPMSAECQLLDVRDRAAVSRTIDTVRPELVMHLAAETDVDRCELEPAHAYLTNAVGTEYVAAACKTRSIRLLYMSTAGVFDGEKPSPYIETDEPNPVNVYGRAKLAGEYAIRQYGGIYQIVRAGWMVGGYERDKKFAGKILRLLEEQHALRVVTDKVGTPTFTEDLTQGLLVLIGTAHVGVFHMTNHGSCSRYDFALKLVEYLGRKDVVISPISSDAFPLPASRAASEVLQNARLESLGLDLMPTWQESLRRYVQQYQTVVKTCVSSS